MSPKRIRAASRRIFLKSRFAAQHVRLAARDIWERRHPTVPLDQVQRRLELLLTAMYGRPVSISVAEPARDSWLARMQKVVSRDPRAHESTPGVDEMGIQLPALLNARDGERAAVARYRLLAIEQAERLARGTAAHARIADPVERDLYLLREGVAVDTQIARTHPGLAPVLDAERAAALARRPKLESLSLPEREVELLLRDALSRRASETGDNPADSAESLAWARATARRVRRVGEKYRGLPPTSLWGVVRMPSTDGADAARTSPTRPTPPGVGVSPMPSAASSEPDRPGDARESPSPEQPADASSNAAQPDVASATDTTDDDSARANDDVSSSGDADATRSAAGNADSPLGDAARAHDDSDDSADLPPAILYDEWDSDAGRYRFRSVTVRLYPPREADERWSTDVLQQHAAIVRQVRHQFERLRARRMLLDRQRAGDDLDIRACVNAIVDRRIGRAPDDRLYLDARPARRGTAISILVDVSGSTEARVTKEWRIVDLERIALLLASEALDALGDLYAIHVFAGKKAQNVALSTIKDFGERNGETVRRRIAGLEPGGFTRLGAAVRHATRQLARQSAGHRLLLILSDGRPNDLDQYQGPYGVEDARQAIMESRASGVFPFCLTVDRDASEYLPRIFGTTGHTILQRPEQLPRSLLGAVRALIGQR